jgi:ribosomal protein L12E/L44/L45/RPP1/RPP2
MPDEDPDDQTNDPTESNAVKALRAENKRLKAQLKQAEPDVDVDTLKRENAFLKAGIKPDDPKAKYFVRGYDGELTADAILAEAKAAGIIAEPAPAPAPNGAQAQAGPGPEAAADETASALAGIDTMRAAAQANRGTVAVQGNDAYEAAMAELARTNPRFTPADIANVMHRHGMVTTQDIGQ